MRVDLLLAGGEVLDGLGAAALRADVAVVGDRVVAVGPDLDVTPFRVLDVSGHVVAPGFIDPHTHSDVVPFMAEPQPFKLLQGVTTEVVGNCGNSAAPLVDDAAVEHHRAISSTAKAGVGSHPRTFAGYLEEVEAAGPTNHVASMVGHHTLRISANGMAVDLAEGALDRMVHLAEEAFAAGAVGFSTGLVYAPGSYGDVDEVSALARVAARWQRPYATHLRDEGDRLPAGVAEAVEVARRTRVRLQVSHCKVAGARNHGRAGELLDALRSARAEGLDVLGDQYPYTTGETFLAALLPSLAQAGGPDALRARLSDPEQRQAWLQVAATGAAPAGGGSPGAWHQTTPAGVTVSMHSDASVQGRTLAALAAGAGVTPWDALCEAVLADPSAMTVYELMSAADVDEITADPLIAVGSDNSVPVGLAHQRAWGCFPTVLARVRETGLLSLPEAVRKMTSASANQFGLVGRGLIAPGCVADLAVVDSAVVGHPGASPANPAARPAGIPHVVLAGEVVVDGGEFTGVRHGRVLRAGHPERGRP